MTNKELNELLRQRKSELEEARRELAENWLKGNRTRRGLKFARRIAEDEEMLANIEALLYPLETPKIGFEGGEDEK